MTPGMEFLVVDRENGTVVHESWGFEAACTFVLEKGGRRIYHDPSMPLADYVLPNGAIWGVGPDCRNEDDDFPGGF